MSELQTHLLAAAIGATIGVISAASLFIYQKVLENQQNTMKSISLDEVNRRLTELQTELETLRVQQTQQRKKKKLIRKHVPKDSTNTMTDNTDTNTFSTADTDVGDDEFFDCSDSEDSITDTDTRTTDATIAGLDLSIFDVHAQQKNYEEDDYFKLQHLANTYPNNVDIIWRYARICHTRSKNIIDVDMKKAALLEGLDACEKLLSLSDADLHKWCAILVGEHGELLPSADRIKSGYRFMELVMKGLEIRPNDSDLHYLLGRFRYELANLSWIQRKLAATLFSELPSASYEDAINSFECAEKFSTEVGMENRLFLSKCYIALSKYEEATYWLEKICDSSVTNTDDEKIQNDARELLVKYSGYR